MRKIDKSNVIHVYGTGITRIFEIGDSSLGILKSYTSDVGTAEGEFYAFYNIICQSVSIKVVKTKMEAIDFYTALINWLYS